MKSPFQSLVAVAAGLAGLLAAASPSPSLAQPAPPLATIAKEVAAGRAVIVDVRSEREWAAGHLALAISMPVDQIAAGKVDLSRLPKDKPVYLHCSVGARSRSAARILQPKGYDARPLDAGPAQLVQAGFAPAR